MTDDETSQKKLNVSPTKMKPGDLLNSNYISGSFTNISDAAEDGYFDQQHNVLSSTDDLAQLETFDEDSIINYMYKRFLSNQIYTYIGDILVVSCLLLLLLTCV